MNTLPPIPLVDGCFLIDNSTIETLTTCPRALQYQKLNQRVLAGGKTALHFGSAIHLALEHRYKTCGSGQPDYAVEDEQGQLLVKYFEQNPPPLDDHRNAEHCFNLIKHYNQRYPVEPFKLLFDAKTQKPMVELSFMLPLYTRKDGMRVFYTGRIDLPVNWDGGVIIIDHKTTSMLGSTFFDELSMSAQQLGYSWAFQELSGLPVRGFCINALRTSKKPMKPKNGDAAWWDESIQRNITYLRPGQLEEWRTNAIALVEEFFWHYDNQYMPMKTKWCVGKYGKCSYFDVCNLPPEQRIEQLNSSLFTDNIWSPLTK